MTHHHHHHHRGHPPSVSIPTRTLWFALVVWLGASVAALTAASYGIVNGLAVGAAGGIVFGYLSARRVDARRMRGRRRSKRA